MKKLVVITGASSGIGQNLAINFSKMGYPTLLLARSLDKMEALNLENSICKKVDVTDLVAMQKAIKEAEDVYGKTDLLINCAGVMMLQDAYKQDYQEWKQMIDVNVNGVLTGINAVLHDMKERNEGTIINISSTAGRKLYDQHAIYCASKYAVHALSEGIRSEVSQSNVRVSVVAPGVVETNLLNSTSDQQIKDDYEAWKKAINQGLDPQQIFDCVNFIYQMPQDVCVRELMIAKTKQKD